MIARALSFLLIPFLFAVIVYSKCAPKPLLLPISDVELSAGANVRGVGLAVGTPSKNISFLVNAGRNETYIYGQDGLCDDSFSDAGCFTYRGGQYDISKSSTASKVDNYRDNDGTSADWFKDNLFAQPDLPINGITIGVPKKDLDQQYKPQAQLGVGKNSSFLIFLKEAGKIGARAYSIFWGLASGPADQQTTGSLILGGIDEALTGVDTKKFTSGFTYDFTCGTGMLVALNDISLNWPNGTDTSIFLGQRSTVMQACLQPDYPGLMTMPLKHWENFVKLAGGNYPGGVESRALGFNFWTMLFEPEGVFYGDLTLSLQNSISIRIPNTQLVVPDKYVDVSTGKVRTNETVRNLPIDPIQEINQNDLPILGRLFFTSAYLSVNHETETFLSGRP
ncbi:uncharacterized protein EI97DRAFT_477957 [Westerdykella ornata]|uniref:Acid protease n=1 Tax=Westerdykella ornata TaxID=318751 RepID=A0A6A6JVU4_WESOR|nr:uncharacterized protein EI97DRAFT_477957 [Westerdykella ornata]KAF2280233.1 hypothetical protein EI97DRAFT_477957 [Westerdykella ornata]